FNPEESISFEGDTGPYLQYTYARASSILRKIKKIPEKADFSLLQKQEEINLIQHLSKFPEIVEEASLKLKPNLIANYAFTLSQSFNEFYHSCPVLTAETETKNARISLLKAFQHVLKNSLTLLNITPLEKM
ncbi:arginine--tRNA ligase, partial [Candidatus Woesearchaeota archaeon]|nr:arginine--tRNA ligase [Candidatus Woesearchaeota archaeon]